MMSEEKAEYMNSPVDELKRYRYCNLDENCLAFVWIEDTEQGIKFRVPRTASTKILDSLNTRAESPDGGEEGDWRKEWGPRIKELAFRLRKSSGHSCVLSMSERHEIEDFVHEALSPPPPVAAEGELIKRLDHWIDRFESGDWPNDSTLKLLKACRSALQHQDGVVMSEEDLGELIEAAEATLENFTQEIQPIQSPIHEMVRKLTGVISRAKQSLEASNER